MAFSACFGTSENRIGIAHLAKISPEIVQAIAVACEQLIQSSESWTYAFPLHLTIDAYKGGVGTSIKWIATKCWPILHWSIYHFLKVNMILFSKTIMSININRPILSTVALCLAIN